MFYSNDTLSLLQMLLPLLERYNESLHLREVRTEVPPPTLAADVPTQLFSDTILVPVTVLCGLLFVVGVTGNILTVLVIVLDRGMRTTTNFYLASLAVADLLTFLVLPLELYRLWQFQPWVLGPVACRGLYYLKETFTYASILHITAFTIERYLAICHPFTAKRVIRKSRVKKLIVAIWGGAFVITIPVLFIFGLEQRWGDAGPVQACTVLEDAKLSGLLLVATASSTVFFFGPVVLMSVMYSLIARHLRTRTAQACSSSLRVREKSTQQVVKMLGVVVVTFVICWLPHHVAQLTFSNIQIWTQKTTTLNNSIMITSFVLVYVSSTINPILYNVMSDKFRKALRRLPTNIAASIVRRTKGGNFARRPLKNSPSASSDTTAFRTRGTIEQTEPLFSSVYYCTTV
ncbi:growth hormone secretagogue receptor type 1-like [Branchiostoma lanceolatum]|uniref:growth hormone secretagogue receptor type 1-like n=1 Tax=Branchiostoma lanceolatum TaxID=7740 RepID=UPI0034518732